MTVSSRVRNHIRSNVISYVALFFALSGGTAWATHPGGANTISSQDIINGEVQRPDIDAASVDSPRLIDDGVRGIDINEATLGRVPVAQLGGIGRWESRSGQGCDVGGDYFTCAFTTIDLPRPTRVLLIGTAKVQTTAFSPGMGTGHCLLATHLANIPDSTTGFTVDNPQAEHIALVATTFAGPGPVDFAIRCRQTAGNVVVFDAAVAAVALSG
jgi:hypothetical protein